MKKYNVTILLPDGRKLTGSYPKLTSLKTLADIHKHEYPHSILGAVCNNKIVELTWELTEDAEIEFLTLDTKEGKRFYIRSIFFVLIKAAKEMFPHAKLHIEYSIGNGYYCYFEGLDWIRAEEVEELETRMRHIVHNDMTFIRKEVPTDVAVEMFRKAGMLDKVKIFSFRKKKKSSVYLLGDIIDYFYGFLAFSTKALSKFKLSYYNRGIVLLLPDMKYPDKIPVFQDSPKFFNIIAEHKKWLDILELENCGQLNEAIKKGRSKEIIMVAEALHEKKLASVADEIHRRQEVLKIISIAGPSSSGKTTTANRLAVQLRVNGFKPFLISLDNYFIDRDKTPLDEHGKHDFESLNAIDVKLFNKHLEILLRGSEIELPKYDFLTGKSKKSGVKLRLPEKGILIVEGIHGLNPDLYTQIPFYNIYKMYVSALTQLNIDHHNRIPTTDCRIIRRLVRDAQFRGHDARETIERWDSVRLGEERNIFPYQEQADIMFNSSLVYEFSVLKTYAEKYLKTISPEEWEYMEAKRLLKFLSFFEPMEEEFIPPNSIIREFIGNSVFNY